MFRRLPSSLPKDVQIPANLEHLGFFVTEKDQIRQIRDPEEKFKYRVNRNDRVNEVHKHAMNTCVNQIVRERLFDLGLEELRLPLGARREDRHVPIFVSKGLELKKRVLVLFGDSHNDQGIFSYRVTGEEGINIGSAVELVKALTQTRSLAGVEQGDAPGIIIANAGQLLWYRGGGRTVSYREWQALPRESAVHEAMRIDEVNNKIPDNKNHIEHVAYVFEHVMNGLANAEARFDIIGLEYTGSAVMHYLSNHWDVWDRRINGVCLATPQHAMADIVKNVSKASPFTDFVERRTRAYLVSHAPLETVISGRERIGCNCYASGETMYEDNVIVKGWRSMLDWFNILNASSTYEEPVFQVINVEAGDD